MSYLFQGSLADGPRETEVFIARCEDSAQMVNKSAKAAMDSTSDCIAQILDVRVMKNV